MLFDFYHNGQLVGTCQPHERSAFRKQKAQELGIQLHELEARARRA